MAPSRTFLKRTWWLHPLREGSPPDMRGGEDLMTGATGETPWRALGRHGGEGDCGRGVLGVAGVGGGNPSPSS